MLFTISLRYTSLQTSIILCNIPLVFYSLSKVLFKKLGISEIEVKSIVWIAIGLILFIFRVTLFDQKPIQNLEEMHNTHFSFKYRSLLGELLAVISSVIAAMMFMKGQRLNIKVNSVLVIQFGFLVSLILFGILFVTDQIGLVLEEGVLQYFKTRLTLR